MIRIRAAASLIVQLVILSAGILYQAGIDRFHGFVWDVAVILAVVSYAGEAWSAATRAPPPESRRAGFGLRDISELARIVGVVIILAIPLVRPFDGRMAINLLGISLLAVGMLMGFLSRRAPGPGSPTL